MAKKVIIIAFYQHFQERWHVDKTNFSNPLCYQNANLMNSYFKFFFSSNTDYSIVTTLEPHMEKKLRKTKQKKCVIARKK